MASDLTVEVIYVLTDGLFHKELALTSDKTVADALSVSGIFDEYPELNHSEAKVGIYGKVVDRTQRLKDGDRVEVYRELEFDPKEARRERALKNKGDKVKKPKSRQTNS